MNNREEVEVEVEVKVTDVHRRRSKSYYIEGEVVFIFNEDLVSDPFNTGLFIRPGSGFVVFVTEQVNLIFA